MQQRWQKKKKHFPLISLVFFVFIAFSILYSESNIRVIHLHQYHGDKNGGNQQYLDPTPAQNFSLSKISRVVIDKSTTCATTVRYSGRRAVSAIHREETGGGRRASEVGSCDFFSGRWIFDNVSHPLYNESSCPYMSDQLACHKHGRPDLSYRFWRWQPRNCNLKR